MIRKIVLLLFLLSSLAIASPSREVSEISPTEKELTKLTESLSRGAREADTNLYLDEIKWLARLAHRNFFLPKGNLGPIKRSFETDFPATLLNQTRPNRLAVKYQTKANREKREYKLTLFNNEAILLVADFLYERDEDQNNSFTLSGMTVRRSSKQLQSDPDLADFTDRGYFLSLGGGINHISISTFNFAVFGQKSIVMDRIYNYDKINGLIYLDLCSDLNQVPALSKAQNSDYRTAQNKIEIYVGIIDWGIDITHPDLMNKITNFGTTDFPVFGFRHSRPGIPDESIGSNDTLTIEGHGTHVSGIATKDSRIGLIPIVGAQYLEAVDFAVTHGAKIINASVVSPDSRTFESLNTAMEKYPNILFVISAGNNTKNIGVASWVYPAVYLKPNQINVAAVDSTGHLARFSNFGKMTVHFAANGVDILSAYSQGSYRKMSGTSMAAPQVTRAAARILMANPQLTPIDIKNIFKLSVVPTVELQNKTIYGGYMDEEGAVNLAKFYHP